MKQQGRAIPLRLGFSKITVTPAREAPLLFISTPLGVSKVSTKAAVELRQVMPKGKQKRLKSVEVTVSAPQGIRLHHVQESLLAKVCGESNKVWFITCPW